jgi:hypothetical protein
MKKVIELLESDSEKIDIEIGLYFSTIHIIGQLSKRYGMELVRTKLEETVKQDAFWDLIKAIDEAAGEDK